MRHGNRELDDLKRDQSGLKQVKSEFAELLYHAGAPEGFSMEWIFDRFEPQEGRQ